MGNAKIKMIDPSQIRYTPQEGEIIQSSIDKKFYIYSEDRWNLMNVDSSGINMGLYEMNKQIIAQLPVLTDLEEKEEVIRRLHAEWGNKYYMLYGKEISYFTLFELEQPQYFGKTVIECLYNVGSIKAIDLTEALDAVEIWVEDEDGPTCMYLFPYDSGIVKVGE